MSEHRRSSQVPWVPNTSVPLCGFTPGQKWKRDEIDWGNCPQKPAHAISCQVVDHTRKREPAVQVLNITQCAREQFDCQTCQLNGTRGQIGEYSLVLRNSHFK